MKTLNKHFVVLLLLACLLLSCSKSPAPGNSAQFDPDGTAHITRMIPMPATITPEAQKWLQSLTLHPFDPKDLAERRALTDKWRELQSAEARRLFPVNVEGKNIAGVRTDILTPVSPKPENAKRVLINLHGGGFDSDSGSQIEGVPIASLAQIKVVSRQKIRFPPESTMSSLSTRSC